MIGLPLHGATTDQIADAIADAHANLLSMSRRADAILSFEVIAKRAGIESHLEEHARGLIRFGDEEGLYLPGAMEQFEREGLALALTRKSLDDVALVVKIASAVIIHSALEEYLLRLCRVGCATNRARVVEWISKQQMQIGKLNRDPAELIDEAIEDWLKKLERDTVLDKWDRLIGLVGYPANLTSRLPRWHFDRKLLQEFDAARHDGVHGTATLLSAFDMNQFKVEYSRACFVLMFHCTKVAGARLNPYRIFHGPEWRKVFPLPNQYQNAFAQPSSAPTS